MYDMLTVRQRNREKYKSCKKTTVLKGFRECGDAEINGHKKSRENV